jgi:plastocyanin
VAMTTRLTGSLVVCAAAAVFTAGALLINNGSTAPTSAVPAKPTATKAKPAAAAGALLVIKDFGFTPVVVKPGAKITVTNSDGQVHTVSASNGSFDVTVKGKAQASLTAPIKPGSYAFVCNIHPTMRGQLTVSK